ncbi:isopeptide-forming domain-containing fimbrial protein [Bifidobacterium sp. SMB2]|uniref:Isopeptide-forming domain-containing fimbrial protein n=1 Tax=Bifidobacterium saimiriisciurei TaxID=2661627 RepID=A0ABX0CDC5_9BIFI|nr:MULTISPECIES: isopeptide-forming domain-containing fimbrial protein [Bifidobacterium]NEG96203.1 isopeptide-forming domain-containing fimbrial protein [Bifidobacterium sp. SMB2]NEH12216.1 isopeptide-forming domain-containing fimbrial protein [Bifidobacterium saimiriisciurei]
MKLKKLFAGVAAAATLLGGMAFGAATASAADGDVVTANATFTFNADNAGQLTGRTIAAYKLADYVQYGSGDNAVYGMKTNAANAVVVNGALKTALNSQTDVDLADALAAGQLDVSAARPWTATAAGAASTTRAFANALAAAQGLQAVAPAPQLTVNGTSATVSLPAGVYLFLDTTEGNADVTKAVPMIVASGTVNDQKQLTDPTADATVDFKNTKNEEKTKEVSTATAAIGDTLTYTLTGKVANPAPESFVFTDRPGTGLTVKAGTEFTVTADGKNVPDSDYTVAGLDADLQGDGVKTFTVTLNDPADYAGKTIVVKYAAQVNEQAAGLKDGVTNELLKNDGKTYQKITTKSYGFDFTKKNAAGQAVPGAKFQVKNGDTVLKFFAKDGVYYLAADQTVAADNKTVFGTLTTPANGQLVFGGLGNGTYTVEETAVAEGYQNFTGKFTVTIANADGKLSDSAALDPFGLVDPAKKTVVNVKSVAELPKTGAAGIAMFVALGVVLAGAAAAVYGKSRRMGSALRA